MSWYTKIIKTTSPNLIKTAAKIVEEHKNISEERWEEFIYITANRMHETSYYAQVTCRQIDNSKNEPYWLMIVSTFSFETGNIVYKKCIYHRKKEDAKNNYDKTLKILKTLRQEQEANNIPTATMPSMIWYAIHDIEGDKDLKPKSAGNIVYLRQDHNLNDNKGNLFKNILYLQKANTNIIEVDPNNNLNSAKSRF